MRQRTVYFVCIDDDIDRAAIFSSLEKAKAYLDMEFNRLITFYNFSEKEKQRATGKYNTENKHESFCIEDMDGYCHLGMVRRFMVC